MTEQDSHLGGPPPALQASSSELCGLPSTLSVFTDPVTQGPLPSPSPAVPALRAPPPSNGRVCPALLQRFLSMGPFPGPPHPQHRAWAPHTSI